MIAKIKKQASLPALPNFCDLPFREDQEAGIPACTSEFLRSSISRRSRSRHPCLHFRIFAIFHFAKIKKQASLPALPNFCDLPYREDQEAGIPHFRISCDRP